QGNDDGRCRGDGAEPRSLRQQEGKCGRGPSPGRARIGRCPGRFDGSHRRGHGRRGREHARCEGRCGARRGRQEGRPHGRQGRQDGQGAAIGLSATRCPAAGGSACPPAVLRLTAEWRRMVCGGTPMSKLKRREYADLLKPIQQELEVAARWAEHCGARILVLFEGRDAAGKGGAIHAIAERLNPRQCRVVALGKPTPQEAGQWYFQRYVAHLPAAGEIVLFDRSWYNRRSEEKVMGFATDAQVHQFLEQVPEFERQLVDDGILLFKYWLACDQDEQEERFAERLGDPLKRWKLSPIDLAAREKYEAYTKAREAMLAATHRPDAPWTLV